MASGAEAMNMKTTDPIAYLTPPQPGFWAWDGETIVFANGTTLAFREELIAVVRRLVPFGLPPLDSLLLFLAAGREGWTLPGGGREAWRAALEALSLPTEGWRERLDEMLLRLNGIGPEWRRQLERTALLAEVIFEEGHAPLRLSERDSRKVLQLLDSGFVPATKSSGENGPRPWMRLTTSLRPLVSFAGSLDPQRLEMRWRTGLDRCLQTSSGEVAPALQVRSLLARLEGDPEFGGLARLAKNLMAAVHVPRALTDPEEMPLGGFSDIANRGSLDRLLVSELAQDDLVLSVRLALNEALYLRRESPPKTPQNARVILIDNGLRLWGVPRLFAVAAGMAVAATAARGTPLKVLVPHETQQLVEVDLGERRSLVEALSHLHPHAHPGNALLELMNRPHAQDSGGNDFILITHAAVLDDEGFQSVLRLLSRDLYIATVDRKGRYAFHACRQGKRRLLKEARFDLEKLLEPERTLDKKAPRLLGDDVSRRLPSLYRQVPFPLLLPPDSWRGHDLRQEGGDRLWVTRDGRLLHLSEPHKGGRQILDRLPKGTPLPMRVVRGLPDTYYVALLAGDGRLTLLLLSKDDGSAHETSVRLRTPPLQAVIDHQLLLLIQPRVVTVHDCLTGEQLGELGLRHRVADVRGRSIFMAGRWYCLAIDGFRPVLEEAVAIEEELESPVDRPMADSGLQSYQRLRGARVDGAGHLILVSRSGAKLGLRLDPYGERLCLQPKHLDLSWAAFHRIASPPHTRYRLSECPITEEHRLILDSRGLLHLCGPDPQLPEVTLILTRTDALSGWASTGEAFGNPYFFPQPPRTKASVFWDYLRAWTDSALLASSV